MANTLTALIERAMNTDSDNEALSCLRQAKKLYRGEGVTLPRRVRSKKSTEVATLDSVSTRELETVRQTMQADIDRATKSEATLSARNGELATENLKLGQTNAELETENTELKRKASTRLQSTIAAWIVATVAVVLLVLSL